MPQVNIPGVGTVAFPDGMSAQDMQAAIQHNFPQIHGQTPTPPPQNPASQPQPNAAAQQDPTAGPQGLPEDMAPQGSPAQQGQVMGNQALAGGVAEGAQRAWAGIKQIGGYLGDAYNKLTTGGSVAPGQAQSPSDQITQQENIRRSSDNQAAVSAYGPTLAQLRGGVASVSEGAILGGGVGGAARAAGVGVTTTLLGNMAKQSALGAVTGYLAFSPTNDKAQDAAITGTVSGVLGIPAAVIPAVGNYIAKKLVTNSTSSELAYQAGKGVMGWGTEAAKAAGTDPTLAMRTGAPLARTMEGASFNSQLQQRYQSIADGFMSKFKAVFQLPDTPLPDIDAAFQVAKNRAEATVSGMRSAASQNYEMGMGKAADLYKNGPKAAAPVDMQAPVDVQGGVPTTPGTWKTNLNSNDIPVQNLQAQFGVIRQMADDPVASGGARPISTRFLNGLETKIGNGNMNAKDMADTLRGLTALIRGSDNNETVAMAHKLMDSVNLDLDILDKGGNASQSAQQILSTRADYRTAMQGIDQLQQTAAYKMLGVTAAQKQVDPGQVLGTFSGFSAEKQSQVRDWLTDNSPALLQQMRRQTIQNAVNAGTPAMTAAANSTTDVGKIIQHLYDGANVKTSGLWNSTELKQLDAFREAARVVSNVGQKQTGGIGTMVGPEEIVPNVISHNPIFIGRQLARASKTVLGADLFTDPDVYNMLTKIRATSGPKQAAIRSSLAAYLGTNYPDTDNAQTQQSGGIPH